jgi:hypothetical protein
MGLSRDGGNLENDPSQLEVFRREIAGAYARRNSFEERVGGKKDMLDLVGRGRNYLRVCETLWGRSQSVKFEDGHIGHIVDSGSTVCCRKEDEILFPMVGSCDVVVADIKMKGGQEDLRFVTHTTLFQTWALPLYLNTLAELGEVSGCRLYGNGYARSGSPGSGINQVASAMEEKTGIRVEPVDFSAGKEFLNTYDLLVTGDGYKVEDLVS